MDKRTGQQESWWAGNGWRIYVSHILSSWGDRMWAFAVGIYLVVLYPNSLQLTAVYGLSVCISVIIFGATLGKWIDRTKRITVARVALIVQNSFVVLCSILLICLIHYNEELESLWNGVGKTAILTSVIVVAVIANLGAEASKIALEKDWIVVLSDGDETKLAKMNATMRSIDLTTFILAPILVGQIITYASQICGAAFIAGWNIFSGFCEYSLLTAIYNRVPELGYKNVPIIKIQSPDHESPNPDLVNKGDTYFTTGSIDTELSFDELAEVSLASPTSTRSWNPFLNRVHPESNQRKSNCLVKTYAGFKKRCQESMHGWKDYFAHPVRGAGVGLALLYMTVLGFDSITTGYAYSQGMSESMLGIMTAVGALFGILGSISFPFLRKNFGKCRTGILGFSLETVCLVLCLVSIVSPGSPFIHKNWIFGETDENGSNSNGTQGNGTKLKIEGHKSLTFNELWSTRISVMLLMIGIICARYGLWIADLSVIQIFQEEIPADKRGVLNGVQGSLNQGMNLLKFIIVVILPNADTFGYLICLSWIFVFSGLVSFMIFSCSHHRRTSTRSNANASLEEFKLVTHNGNSRKEENVGGESNNNINS